MAKRIITDKTREIRNFKSRDKSAEAQCRREDRAAKTNLNQLDVLDRRLGFGLGAKRERNRLGETV